MLFAGLAWVVLRRLRGLAILVALVLGSLVGAWLAWWLGVRIALDEFQAIRDSVPIGARVDAPLVLRLTDLDRNALWPPKVTGVAVVQAWAAGIAYTVLAGFSVRPGLRPPPKSAKDQKAATGQPPAAVFSSGPDAPAGPPA